MQDLVAEREFYAELFSKNPENEHISSGYDELHALALPVLPKGTILDLGCGTGSHTVRLRRRGCAVIAMDLTREGVRGARMRLAREHLSGWYVVGDAEHLPFKSGSVDTAWTFLLLHHFPKLDDLVREIARVTREQVITLEPNAQNALTWAANNILNRFVGTRAMTRNQRALWPWRVSGLFRAAGFATESVHYVDRRWADKLGWVRGTYALLTRWLPQRFRANKFLMVLKRASR